MRIGFWVFSIWNSNSSTVFGYHETISRTKKVLSEIWVDGSELLCVNCVGTSFWPRNFNTVFLYLMFSWKDAQRKKQKGGFLQTSLVLCSLSMLHGRWVIVIHQCNSFHYLTNKSDASISLDLKVQAKTCDYQSEQDYVLQKV